MKNENKMRCFFQNKVVLITGASSGIGYDLALLLSSWQTRLVLTARRKEKLEELKIRCEKNGAQVFVFTADVTNQEAMQVLQEETLKKLNFVDIIVANAGVGGLNPADNFSQEVNRQVYEINCFGLVNTVIPFIPSMIQRGQGQIVGISSLAAFRGLPKVASYSSAKAAQRIFLESLRVDLRRYNIFVSSIHPGFVKTPMTNHSHFKMPFMVDVRKSSVLLAKAIMKRKSLYLYPWQMKYLTYFNRLLPNFLYDKLILQVSKYQRDLTPRLL